jgi:hypothetical protein
MKTDHYKSGTKTGSGESNDWLKQTDIESSKQTGLSQLCRHEDFSDYPSSFMRIDQ